MRRLLSRPWRRWCPDCCPGRGFTDVPAGGPAGVPAEAVPLNAGELQPSDVVYSDPKILLPRDGAVLDMCVIHARIAGDLAVIPPDTVLSVPGTGKVLPPPLFSGFSPLS